ncbi:MAG: hypothetical protein R6U66_08405 [Bacteroidales bacterium]
MKVLFNLFTNSCKACVNPLAATFVLFTLSASTACAQEAALPQEVHLIDTLAYTEFAVTHLESRRYPPAHLFDADPKTCWVYSATDSTHTELYVKVPAVDEPVLNLIGGYSKSASLYRANGRPAKIQLSLYQARQPEGMVSETGIGYQLFPLMLNQTVELADTLKITSIPLNLDDKAYLQSAMETETSPPDSLLEKSYVVKLSFPESYAGEKYKDNCISELFFTDRFISPRLPNQPAIKNVYVNEKETALIGTTSDRDTCEIYSDTTSVLQLTELSPKKRWAIVIAMPQHVEGRAESYYYLIDVWNRKEVTSELVAATGTYLPGAMLFFETREDQLILFYHSANYETREVRLIE